MARTLGEEEQMRDESLSGTVNLAGMDEKTKPVGQQLTQAGASTITTRGTA